MQDAHQRRLGQLRVDHICSVLLRLGRDALAQPQLAECSSIIERHAVTGGVERLPHSFGDSRVSQGANFFHLAGLSAADRRENADESNRRRSRQEFTHAELLSQIIGQMHPRRRCVCREDSTTLPGLAHCKRP